MLRAQQQQQLLQQQAQQQQQLQHQQQQQVAADDEVTRELKQELARLHRAIEEGESIEVCMNGSDGVPPAWIASTVLQVHKIDQFKARIMLPNGVQREHWFQLQEEGVIWRR